MKEYIEFLKDKMAISCQTGFEVNPDELTPSLYPHVKDTVRWAVCTGDSQCDILQFRYAENRYSVGDTSGSPETQRRQRADSLSQTCSG